MTENIAEIDLSAVKTADTETLAAHARGYMAAGMRILPLWGITAIGKCQCPKGRDCSSPGKHPHPAVPRGLKDASTDPTVIDQWMAAGWRNGNLGMVTDGLAVIDLDGEEGAESWATVKAQHGEPPVTRRQSTGKGSHLFFLAPEGLVIGNSAGKLGPNIDVRGTGGYVAVEPSTHVSGKQYVFRDRGVPLETLPDAYAALLAQRKQPDPTPLEQRHPRPTESKQYDGAYGGSSYGLGVLRNQSATVEAAGEGTRNVTLNSAAFACGQYVAGGELDEQHAFDTLLNAADACGLSHSEAKATIASGFKAGATDPRSAPFVADPTESPPPETNTLKPGEIEIPDFPAPERTEATETEKRQASATLPALLADTEAFIRRFVVLTDEQATAVALWAIHTHVFRATSITPYLEVYSAEMQSGKSTLLMVLQSLSANAWWTGGSTAAALIRKVDAEAPTLFYDEADATFKAGGERAEFLRGILNNGFRVSGSYTVAVPKGKNGDFEAKDFSVYCPKAIAGIGRLPETVQSRSIPIELRRKLKGKEVGSWRERDCPPQGRVIRDRIAAWAEAGAALVLAPARPETPPELSDRAADFWECLLAIADLAGTEAGEKARSAAIALCAAGTHVEETIGLQTLRAIKTLWDSYGPDCDRLTTLQIIKGLAADDEGKWQHWWEGDRPSLKGAQKLAKTLKPYGLKSQTIRIDGPTPTCRGYLRETMEEVWERYL